MWAGINEEKLLLFQWILNSKEQKITVNWRASNYIPLGYSFLTYTHYVLYSSICWRKLKKCTDKVRAVTFNDESVLKKTKERKIVILLLVFSFLVYITNVTCKRNYWANIRRNRTWNLFHLLTFSRCNFKYRDTIIHNFTKNVFKSQEITKSTSDC